MKKTYSEELQHMQFEPKKSTLSFILNYSKSIEVINNIDDEKIMFNLN